jgi:hypothetical protein
VPVKDLFPALIWLLAFMGNRIELRGQQIRFRRGGSLVRSQALAYLCRYFTLL